MHAIKSLYPSSVLPCTQGERVVASLRKASDAIATLAAPPLPLPIREGSDGGAASPASDELLLSFPKSIVAWDACVRAGSIKDGLAAEDRFLVAMANWTPAILSKEQAQEYDMSKHVDFVMRRANGGKKEELWVDVKSMRKVNGLIQNEYIVLELHPRGFLLGGESDVLAFELSADPPAFALLAREELRDWIFNKMRKEAQPPVPFANQSLFRYFARSNHSGVELMTMVPLADAWAVAGCAIVQA